jgi:hypothetical protein
MGALVAQVQEHILAIPPKDLGYRRSCGIRPSPAAAAVSTVRRIA